MIIGILLLCAALGLAGYNIFEGLRAKAAAEQAYSQMLENMRNAQFGAVHDKFSPNDIYDPNMEMTTVNIDGYDCVGVLEVPAFELELPVMDVWSYDRLTMAPCRYAGTPYKSGFVNAGHNYIQHFGRLSNLNNGDTVKFTDAEGRTFEYSVREIVSLEATDVDEMISDVWDLTLFTCTLSGMQRVSVRCELTAASVSGRRLLGY